MLVETRRTGPADTAASRIDFPAWLDTLIDRDREIAEELAVGERGKDVAERAMDAAACIGCGACIANCPRGTLRWGPAILVRYDNTLEISPSALPISLDFNSRRSE